MLRGWRPGGPGEGSGAGYEPVAALFSEPDEASQQDVLIVELEPQRALSIDVAGKISAQHHASPGQGCAICCSIVTSTLA
jgi:hypothetical protein